MDTLFLDGQSKMHQGSKILNELKSSSDYPNLSFYKKSKVLSALADSKNLFTKTDLKLSNEPFFSGK